VIHCHHCGTDSTAAPDVDGKHRANCGETIYSEAFKREMAEKPPTSKAPVDRTGEVLRASCPRCGFRNEFPGLDMVYIFLCEQCGEPVEGEEMVQ
jgi:hypothetical protein